MASWLDSLEWSDGKERQAVQVYFRVCLDFPVELETAQSGRGESVQSRSKSTLRSR